MEHIDLFGAPLPQVQVQQSKSDRATGADSDDNLPYADRAYMERVERLYAGDVPRPCSVEQAFRHGGWAADRRRVRAALIRTGATEKRRERFEGCGGGCVCEVQQGTGKGRLKAFYCGDRFCVPCGNARASRVRQSLLKLCEGREVRFLTLTLRASDDPLSDILDRLIRSFARLREQKFWRASVKAGAYCVEIKRGSGSKKWHVHLHALVIGSYIPLYELTEGWKAASGGSFIVDLRAVGQDSKRIGYVAKYATKGFDRSVLAVPDDLDECMCCLRGRRVLGTFGAWRSLELEVEPRDEGRWKVVGRFADVWAQAVDGSAWAVGFFRGLKIDLDLTREQGEDDPPGGFDPQCAEPDQELPPAGDRFDSIASR